MEKLMKNFFRSSMVTSLVLIILGILLYFESEATIVTISYIIGGILLALGVMAIVRFIRNTNNVSKNDLDIVYGVVTIILGVLVISNPHAIGSIIPIILGIGIIVSSATKLQYAFELKANQNNLWKTTMVISLISTLCGVVLLFNPFKGAVILTKIIGVFIIIYAILDIISTTTINKNVITIQQSMDKNIVDAEIIEEKEEKSHKKKKKNK